ncbi:hypothetical protein KY290_024952 [Solanum tuberosum]|uniref:Uncharacterized protein n=1 Tax=Solanum tuberosum TaxID=4113 RepID=A0ABQ7US45_SOLTU|nr:hypothetical protein KY290_024952 [Solanum tuberosum]
MYGRKEFLPRSLSFSGVCPAAKKLRGMLASEMLKRKNKLKHGEKMTLDNMVAEIDRNIHRIAIVRYPWPRNIPEKWSYLVRFLEGV